MRDRRRNGAKNNRGPAFIFGKNAANQNEIELRFLEGNMIELDIIIYLSHKRYNWDTASQDFENVNSMNSNIYKTYTVKISL